MTLPDVLDITSIQALYASGAHTPASLFAALHERIGAADPAIFITPAAEADLTAAIDALLARAPAVNSLPLWGIPFAVKDNIDVAGLPTTAACTAFAHEAAQDATVVAKLTAAGAIVVGKTNLDQFATGLNGTRSPYGIPRCVFDAACISGGSSSGSAVAVAAGLASFALGTDTAGSGRVPAAFNNLVGIKPTPGLLSTSGVVPACRSLDCVSIFALDVADGTLVRRIAEGLDPSDPFSRRAAPVSLPAGGLRVGVLAEADREFFGNDEGARLYREAIERLDATVVEIDFAPFREIAALLYQGPWVAERTAAFETFGVPEDALDPSVRQITLGGRSIGAVDAFRGIYQLAELRRRTERSWAEIDVLLLPTTPRIYRVERMLADPIRLNSRLGIYTNFFNLLGLAGIAIPAGFGADGMANGVTLAAPAFADDALAAIALRLHRALWSGMGRDRQAPPPAATVTATDGRLKIAVVGAHLTGMPLNRELTELGATLVERTRTSSAYRLYVLPDTTPPKPGLIRDPGSTGQPIELEVWSLPPASFGRFVERIPAPLSIGKVELASGERVSGFLCEAAALRGAEEITALGGWRAYMRSKA